MQSSERPALKSENWKTNFEPNCNTWGSLNGMWRCIVGRAVFGFFEWSYGLIFWVNQYKQRTAGSWKWRCYDTLKCRELLAHRHSVISPEAPSLCCTVTLFFRVILQRYRNQLWDEYLSRYSDWLLAGRSGIESRWGRDFSPIQTGPGAHPDSCKMGTGSFPGVKCGRGVLLTTHPLLVPQSWKSRAMPLPTLWTTPGL